MLATGGRIEFAKRLAYTLASHDRAQAGVVGQYRPHPQGRVIAPEMIVGSCRKPEQQGGNRPHCRALAALVRTIDQLQSGCLPVEIDDRTMERTIGLEVKRRDPHEAPSPSRSSSMASASRISAASMSASSNPIDCGPIRRLEGNRTRTSLSASWAKVLRPCVSD